MSWLGGSQPFVKHASTTHVAFRPFTQAYSREISGTVAAESKLKVSWGFVQNCLNFSFWMLVFLSLCVLWFCIFFSLCFCFHFCISVFSWLYFCVCVFMFLFLSICACIFMLVFLNFCVFMFVLLCFYFCVSELYMCYCIHLI